VKKTAPKPTPKPTPKLLSLDQLPLRFYLDLEAIANKNGCILMIDKDTKGCYLKRID